MNQIAVIPQQAAPVSFAEKERMASAFAKSGLFGVKTQESALALILLSEAEGSHPARAVMEYDIINGKPARKAESLLARFQMSGGKVEWAEYTNTAVVGKFSHPQGSDVTIKWTMEDAQRAGLAGKDNWKKHPRPMLRSRVISEGVRTCYPAASLVTFTSEEAVDADFVEVDEHEPAPQIAPQTTKSAHQQRKDGEDKAFDARIDACTSHGQLEALLEDPAFTSMRSNWQEVFRDKIESKMDLIASSTAELKTALLPTFDELKASLSAQKGRDAVQAWGSKTLSAEILDTLTTDQRNVLRTIYKEALNG